jgi:hypothetical protein
MGYNIKSYPSRALLSGLILLTSGPCLAAPATQAIAFDTANALMAAVGKVKLTTAQVESSLAYCPARFPHLLESAEHARSQWHEDNQTVLDQTARVNTAVLESVKQNASAFIAEKMALEMDALVAHSVQQLNTEFAAKPAKEQHYLCNRLILSIATGERDLRVQDPDETQRLMDFKP